MRPCAPYSYLRELLFSSDPFELLLFLLLHFEGVPLLLRLLLLLLRLETVPLLRLLLL
jgi:hypothetical protein